LRNWWSWIVGWLPLYKWCFGKEAPQIPENKAATEEVNDEAETEEKPESSETTL
jgi:hypothetical protein